MQRSAAESGREPLSLEQRRARLQRILAEVEVVSEDIQATAASLLATDEPAPGPFARATLSLLWDAQLRQQSELKRLYREYDALAFGQRSPTNESERAAA